MNDLSAQGILNEEFREGNDQNFSDYKQIFDNSPLGIPVVNSKGVIVKANLAFEEMMGYLPGELIGKRIVDITHPDDVALFNTLMDKLFATKEKVVRFKKRNLKKNGEILELEVTSVLIHSFSGKPFVFNMAEDITEKNASKRVLATSEHKFRALYENAPVGIPILDEKGRFLDANRKFTELMGYNREELRSLTFLYITHHEDLKESFRLFDELKRGERKCIDVVKRYVRKDRSVVFAHTYVVSIPDLDGTSRFFAMIEDLTNKINTENNLREMEQVFKTMLENVSMGVALIDENGTINRSFGSNMERPEFKSRFAVGSEIRNALSDHQKKAASALKGEKVEFLQSGLQDGKPWALQHFIVPNEARGKGAIDIMIDVTDLKEENRRVIEERALELKRYNQEIQDLSKIASHNFGEPLNRVQQLLERLEGGPLSDVEGQETVKHIMEQVSSMQQILENLKKYFQIEGNDRLDESVDTEELLDGVKKQLSDLIVSKNARITHGSLPKVKGSAHQLHQVFCQLVSNGIKYCKDKKPKIHFSAEAENNHYLFKVSDNGEGFGEGRIEAAFRIFKSDKQDEHESCHGIGLALVKKVIENHKGKIWISSEKNRGTTVYFTIPKDPERASAYADINIGTIKNAAP